MEKAPAVAVLIIALVSLLKGLWMLFGPGAFKSFLARWVKVVRQINTLTGIACVLLALLLWLVVLLGQPPEHWILVVVGGLFVFAASLYFRREVFEKTDVEAALAWCRQYIEQQVESV